jgi:hypothetical protein
LLLLKDIEILSTNGDSKAPVSATQAEWEILMKTVSLVMIKAITNPGSWVVKVIFLHDKKKFRVELDKAKEGAIILP